MLEKSQQEITNEMWRRLFYDLENLIQILGQKVAQDVIAPDNSLKALNSAQIIMAPSVSNTMVVLAAPNPPTFLIENTVLNLMQVTISNDDFAIPVYLGDRDVVVPAGDLIDPRQRITYYLRRGQKKYAIANAGSVNVIVSRCESAYGAVTVDAEKNGIVM